MIMLLTYRQGPPLGYRLLYEPAPGISTNLEFLSLGKLYENINFTT